MTDAYLPTPAEIEALTKQIRGERAAGFITVQVKGRDGRRRCVRRKIKHARTAGNTRGRNEEYSPKIRRLRLS